MCKWTNGKRAVNECLLDNHFFSYDYTTFKSVNWTCNRIKTQNLFMSQCTPKVSTRSEFLILTGPGLQWIELDLAYQETITVLVCTILQSDSLLLSYMYVNYLQQPPLWMKHTDNNQFKIYKKNDFKMFFCSGILNLV